MEICSRCNGTGLFGNCPDCDGIGYSQVLASRAVVPIETQYDKANEAYKTLVGWTSNKPGSEAIVSRLMCDYDSLKSKSRDELFAAVDSFISHVNALVNGSQPSFPVISKTILDSKNQACADLKALIRNRSFGYRSRGGAWFSDAQSVERVAKLMEVAGDAIPDSLKHEIQIKVFPPKKL